MRVRASADDLDAIDDDPQDRGRLLERRRIDVLERDGLVVDQQAAEALPPQVVDEPQIARIH